MGRRFVDWRALDSRGAACGVVVYWDKRVLQALKSKVVSFLVSCLFKNCEDGFCWVFIGVCGPVISLERENFWRELGFVKGLWSDP